jgi:hypothetical protein
MKKNLWIFGNAVQDITVEVDVDRISREINNFREKIGLTEHGPELAKNLWLKTQIGSQEFAVNMELKETSPLKNNNMYTLLGGEKYTLTGDILDKHKDVPDNVDSLFLPCENISWGGGGANVVTFLRALAPNYENVPIKYTDIAMSRSLPILIQKLEKIRKNINIPNDKSGVGRKSLARQLSDLYDKDPIKAEITTNEIAATASNYSPERSLEIYLASLPVESVLYRPKNPRFRRNWVFSHFRTASREVDNKIILKGTPDAIPDAEEGRIKDLLESNNTGVGAIMLNSLKDGPLFRAAYSLYKKSYENGEDVVAIFAMTKAMQEFTEWMLKNKDRKGNLPPFILILNESEAHSLANKFGGKTEPFMKEDELPDIEKFAQIALTIWSKFDVRCVPRIYVTLGPRGSLGVDRGGNVVYVSCYAKSGATIYDTNACGDAYCSAIALLEWAKRHGKFNSSIAKVDPNDPLESPEEMRYFMSVATAAAYCKATNRRGRVYAADIKDLLQYNHLASVILPHVRSLAELTKDIRRPDCIDADNRLREPACAMQVGITDALNNLIG